MHAFTLLPTFLLAAASLHSSSSVLAAPTPQQAQQVAPVSSGQALVYALQNAGLNKLGETLQSQIAVANAIMAAPGPKLFLAPNDQAMEKLPGWVTRNQDILQATLLQHVLNGSFDTSQIATTPQHSIGYSMLTDTRFVNLPGGNGMPVALSKRADQMFIAEALDECKFDQANMSSFYEMQIAPITRAMTVPGNTSFTLDFVRGNDALMQSVGQVAQDLQSELDSMKGITIFAPTNEAFSKVTSQLNTIGPDEMKAIIGQHVIQNRVVYSSLLKSQGSMVTASGQDLVFDADKMTVKVGNTTASIVQSDIITANGVIHRIDTVLLDNNMDASRAAQAKQSAQDSQLGPINGFVSGSNAGSSQGTSVPAAQQGSGARNSNSSMTGNGGVQRGVGLPAGSSDSGANGGGSSNGNGGFNFGQQKSSAPALNAGKWTALFLALAATGTSLCI